MFSDIYWAERLFAQTNVLCAIRSCSVHTKSNLCVCACVKCVIKVKGGDGSGCGSSFSSLLKLQLNVHQNEQRWLSEAARLNELRKLTETGQTGQVRRNCSQQNVRSYFKNVMCDVRISS